VIAQAPSQIPLTAGLSPRALLVAPPPAPPPTKTLKHRT
jgi:hypothetical protein